MAQRGGSVQASVIMDSGISPVIPTGGASCVLGFEPVETARALASMSSSTVVYMNTSPVIPYILGQRSALKQANAEYPEVEELARCIRDVTSHLFLFDATELAIEAGSVKALNMVMLGCLLGFGSLPCAPDRFWDAAARTMPRRLAKTNSGAFSRGVELGEKFQHAEMTQ